MANLSLIGRMEGKRYREEWCVNSLTILCKCMAVNEVEATVKRHVLVWTIKDKLWWVIFTYILDGVIIFSSSHIHCPFICCCESSSDELSVIWHSSLFNDVKCSSKLEKWNISSLSHLLPGFVRNPIIQFALPWVA